MSLDLGKFSKLSTLTVKALLSSNTANSLETRRYGNYTGSAVAVAFLSNPNQCLKFYNQELRLLPGPRLSSVLPCNTRCRILWVSG